MKLAIIFDRFTEGTLGIYYEKALRHLGVAVQHFWLKDAQRIQPEFDGYVRIDDGDYKHDIPHERLKPSFFYASDVHLKKPFLSIKKAARYYNHIFCAQYNGWRTLAACYPDKVSWLPHAHDPEIHRDIGCERKLDVAFVGNDGGIPRKFLLQELRERFPNSYIGNADYRAIARIYSSAKIGFNYSIKDDICMRMFEVTGCGALLLTNAIADKGFTRLFTANRNIVAYTSPKEIFGLIDYYVRHAAEREAIANEGKQLVNTEHTYLKRATCMLETIRRITKKDEKVSTGV